MKKLAILFFFCQSLLFSQELKLMKATQQTINAGASPVSITNYLIQFKKGKSFLWHVDSVCSIASNNSIKYNLIKVDNPDAISPQYHQIKTFSKNDKGLFQIAFGSRKSHRGGRPGIPIVDVTTGEDYSLGVIVFYTAGKKKKQLKVNSFEKLETVNAP
jgi:hypothetical protein